MTSLAFSCVVDDVPVLLAQTFIWVNCLKRLQSINPRDIFVHIVEVQNSEFLDWLQAEQVKFVTKLARLWRFWALWCLERSELFESFSVHADQVSFALAMRELRANVRQLPIAWNYPTHLRLDGLPDVSPEIIHYHRDFTAALKLKTVGVPSVDASIGHLNDGIEHFPREAWLGTVLQNFRDGLGPGLGAGAQPHGLAAAEPAPGLGSAAARGDNFATGRSQPGKVVVGSGWWCDEKPHDWAIGSPVTRSVPFFDLWYRQVVRCLQPDRIVITDSASPIKPDYHSY